MRCPTSRGGSSSRSTTTRKKTTTAAKRPAVPGAGTGTTRHSKRGAIAETVPLNHRRPGGPFVDAAAIDRRKQDEVVALVVLARDGAILDRHFVAVDADQRPDLA